MFKLTGFSVIIGLVGATTYFQWRFVYGLINDDYTVQNVEDHFSLGSLLCVVTFGCQTLGAIVFAVIVFATIRRLYAEGLETNFHTNLFVICTVFLLSILGSLA